MIECRLYSNSLITLSWLVNASSPRWLHQDNRMLCHEKVKLKSYFRFKEYQEKGSKWLIRETCYWKKLWPKFPITPLLTSEFVRFRSTKNRLCLTSSIKNKTPLCLCEHTQAISNQQIRAADRRLIVDGFTEYFDSKRTWAWVIYTRVSFYILQDTLWWWWLFRLFLKDKRKIVVSKRSNPFTHATLIRRETVSHYLS